MIAIRLVPIAAIAVLGLTVSAAAQMIGPGMPMPGQAPPQQQQLPPCFAEFKPLRDEAEKRGLALKAGIQKKVSREEACTLIKSYSAAEAKVVKFIQANATSCGIPAEAATAMKANHTRTQQSEKQVCSGGGAAGGAAKPTGPGLSDALGTTRGGALDPLAPNSGTLDTLTGNVLAK
jgi:hypothetical protein